ncbi:MAG: four helix bundle protein [Muribaculaceae bacterium]|nr:four helix bundle protein [Muribaculaceae bacterium]
MEEIFFTFETLDVYKKARKLVKDIYLLLEVFPTYEKYSLCDQIRRSAISVPSNLAEGSGRFSIKERMHFVEISYGSLMELYCQLSIANDLGYFSVEKQNELKIQIDEIARMLYGLRTSLKNKLKQA